jgi:hypothetical protein
MEEKATPYSLNPTLGTNRTPESRFLHKKPEEHEGGAKIPSHVDLMNPGINPLLRHSKLSTKELSKKIV